MRRLTILELTGIFAHIVNLGGVELRLVDGLLDKIFEASMKPAPRPFNWDMYSTEKNTMEVFLADMRPVIAVAQHSTNPDIIITIFTKGFIFHAADDGRQCSQAGVKNVAASNNDLVMRLTDKPIQTETVTSNPVGGPMIVPVEPINPVQAAADVRRRGFPPAAAPARPPVVPFPNVGEPLRVEIINNAEARPA